MATKTNRELALNTIRADMFLQLVIALMLMIGTSSDPVGDLGNPGDGMGIPPEAIRAFIADDGAIWLDSTQTEPITIESAINGIITRLKGEIKTPDGRSFDKVYVFVEPETHAALIAGLTIRVQSVWPDAKVSICDPITFPERSNHV